MPTRDFFAFCTSLKPIELRAIGALSRVEHLPASEVIYKPGDESETLYIINRGVVEIGAEISSRPLPGKYLSRGNIFGEAEVLTEVPRKQRAKSCEPVSLQCFSRKDLPELMQRVPTFFRYLCQELAARLIEDR
jgi:CRP/FNR family transcriptional regulator